MTASKLPIGLPRHNPTKSYWQTPPLPIADHRSTPSLPPSSKYVIVGSGITGASIAWKLLSKEPDASITIIEARQACSGATGRNGGHCRAGLYAEFKDHVLNFGTEDALRIEVLEEENVQNLGKFIKEHGIECDLQDVETLDIFTDPTKWKNVLAALEEREKVFKGRVEAKVLTKHRIWSAKETKEQLLIPDGVGAVSFPAYSLSPYKFVCALLEMCMEKGLNLQTNTAVLEVEPYRTHDSKKGFVVHTKRGQIVADVVILATNAYTSALYPPLAETIIPTRAQVAAIRPGSKIAGNPVLERTQILESSISGEYMQSRAEGLSGAGDIILGGGRHLGTDDEQPVLDDTTIHPRISHYLTYKAAPYYYGKENWGENGKVLQEWTGIMGYTLDKQPIVGEAPGQKGLWICAGFNGHGMALTFQSAEALVQMMTGREKEANEWFPSCYKLARISKRS